MTPYLDKTKRKIAIPEKGRAHNSLADKFRDLRELCESEGYTLNIPSRSVDTP